MWLRRTCGSIGKIVVLCLAFTDVHFNCVKKWNALAHQGDGFSLSLAFDHGFKPNRSAIINAGNHDPESPLVWLVSKREVVLQMNRCTDPVIHGINGGVIALPYCGVIQCQLMPISAKLCGHLMTFPSMRCSRLKPRMKRSGLLALRHFQCPSFNTHVALAFLPSGSVASNARLGGSVLRLDLEKSFFTSIPFVRLDAQWLSEPMPWNTHQTLKCIPCHLWTWWRSTELEK